MKPARVVPMPHHHQLHHPDGSGGGGVSARRGSGGGSREKALPLPQQQQQQQKKQQQKQSLLMTANGEPQHDSPATIPTSNVDHKSSSSKQPSTAVGAADPKAVGRGFDRSGNNKDDHVFDDDDDEPPHPHDQSPPPPPPQTLSFDAAASLTTAKTSSSTTTAADRKNLDYTDLVSNTYFQQQIEQRHRPEDQHDEGVDRDHHNHSNGVDLSARPRSAVLSSGTSSAGLGLQLGLNLHSQIGLESEAAAAAVALPRLSTASSLSMSEMFNDSVVFDPSPNPSSYHRPYPHNQNAGCEMLGLLPPSVEDSTANSINMMMGHGTPPLTVDPADTATVVDSDPSGAPITGKNSLSIPISNSLLDPYAMYGPISPAVTVTSVDESAGSGRNTPTTVQQYASHYHWPAFGGSTKIPTNAGTSSDAYLDGDNGPIGSVSTTASSVKSGTSISITPKPLLYSAIGSLEQVNQSSLRALNNRLLEPAKEFCRPGNKHSQQQQYQTSYLIPPATNYPFNSSNNHHQQQHQKSLMATGSNNGFHQPSLQATSQESNFHSSDEPHSHGSTGHHHESSRRKLRGEKVFGVLKNHSTATNFGHLSNKTPADEHKMTTPPPTEIQTETKPLQSLLRSKTKTCASTTDDIPHRLDKIPQKKTNKKVSYDSNTNAVPTSRKKKQLKKPIEMFRPSSDAYTPRIEKRRIEYKAAEARTPVQHMEMGTLQRPNFRDALRRVAMIIHQHVVKIESRYDGESETKLSDDNGLFRASMRDVFHEDSYRTPTYKVTMTRIPMACPGMIYGQRKIKVKYSIPSETEIYEFAHQLFKSVQLSSECSIVCLIYVERLMEAAKVPLLACTWRPIFMCGLLLASKVWQDVSSWNVEFSSVYPQFSLEAINRLELNYVRNIKWDLYISSSLYAKYYFALRSLVEKNDFRKRYNRMVGGVDNVARSEALKVQQRTERVKEEALLQISRSM